MTQLVSLSDEAYLTLKKMKGSKMSFSEVVLALVSKANLKHDFLKLAGSLNAEAGELERFKKGVNRDRAANLNST